MRSNWNDCSGAASAAAGSTQPRTIFFPARTRGDYPITMAGWGTLTGEAGYALSGFVHCKKPGGRLGPRPERRQRQVAGGKDQQRSQHEHAQPGGLLRQCERHEQHERHEQERREHLGQRERPGALWRHERHRGQGQ